MALGFLQDVLSVVFVLLGFAADLTIAVPSSSDCLRNLVLSHSRSIYVHLEPPMTHNSAFAVRHGVPELTHSRSFVSSSSSSVPIALNCSDDQQLVMVKIRLHRKRRTGTAGVFACPTVQYVHLQLIGGPQVSFVHVPSNVRVTSCTNINDTAVMRKGHHRSHRVLRFYLGVSESSPELRRLNYTFSIHENDAAKKGRHKQEKLDKTKHVIVDDHHSIEHGFRWRRSAQEEGTTVSSSAEGSPNDTKDERQFVLATDSCGNSTSCIRYGTEGCGHFTCDYMLSYTVINNDAVDMEMSALGQGWVAVGFSSDKFMGGDDDVIACQLERRLSTEVVAKSYGNSVKHTQPQEKKNRLELVQGRAQDDYIYCRIRRPLKYKHRLADSDLDLSNDWHQLYAFGDVDSTGRIMQHTELPRVSENKISMIRPTNIMIRSSATSLPSTSSWLVSLALPLALIFAGS